MLDTCSNAARFVSAPLPGCQVREHRYVHQGEIEIEKQKFMEALDKEKKIFASDLISWQKRIDMVRYDEFIPYLIGSSCYAFLD